MPAIKTERNKPIFIVKKPPINVKQMVVNHPTPFEKIPMSVLEKPISFIKKYRHSS